FLWGRRAAWRRAEVEQAAAPKRAMAPAPARTLDEVIARRVEFLTRYQNAAYARRYEALVRRVAEIERAKIKTSSELAGAVARGLYKLMAYKDEYEVARLYTDGDFLKKLNAQFEGDFTLNFHLAPPLLAERDEASGHLKKRTYGPWMLKAFALLARLKGLRGTPLDIFGYSDERKTERRLIGEHERVVEELISRLSPENHAIAVALARLPERIRGFGHIKEANLKAAKASESELLALFRTPAPTSAIAAQ